jgi:hypothetical protein
MLLSASIVNACMMSFLAPAGPQADSAHDIHHSVGQDKQAESEEGGNRNGTLQLANDGEAREVGLGTPGTRPEV